MATTSSIDIPARTWRYFRRTYFRSTAASQHRGRRGGLQLRRHTGAQAAEKRRGCRAGVRFPFFVANHSVEPTKPVQVKVDGGFAFRAFHRATTLPFPKASR